MEDHQLPLVGGNALIRTGSRLEKPDQIGLAEITGTVIRTGGTEKHSSPELNELLEQRAATVETAIGISSGSASFSALTEDIDQVFDLFAEVVRYPAFATNQVELAINQQKGEISRRNDDPGDIASREFKKIIYGDDSPYARTVEYADLKKISREEIIDFYKTYFRPENTILGIVGDFQPEKMKQLIEKAFGDWQGTPPTPKIIVPGVIQRYKEGVFLVNMNQLTQSNIFLGHIGGKLDSPDYPALSLVNEVLNGFAGRLFNEIRSRQGLAYSVYGFWNANYDFPGYFIAGGQTRSEASVPFVKSILQEINRIRTTPVSEQELSNAKESILNSFVFKFENPGQTLARLMTYEYYGYPADFIFRYQDAIAKTTITEIQQAAEKHLKPEQMLTLVVGNSQQIQPPLSNLGEQIQVVDVSIPQS
jgi:zinc protease